MIACFLACFLDCRPRGSGDPGARVRRIPAGKVTGSWVPALRCRRPGWQL